MRISDKKAEQKIRHAVVETSVAVKLDGVRDKSKENLSTAEKNLNSLNQLIIFTP